MNSNKTSSCRNSLKHSTKKGAIMNNKKTKQVLNTMIYRGVRKPIRGQLILHDRVQNSTGSDFFEQIEENAKQHEQEGQAQNAYDIATLAAVVANALQEIHEMKKALKRLESVANENNTFNYGVKKEQKKHSKRIAKLRKVASQQDAEQESCHKQLEQMGETIVSMARYLGVGNTSDDLRKIQKKCGKAIEKRLEIPSYSLVKKHKVVDGEYREVQS